MCEVQVQNGVVASVGDRLVVLLNPSMVLTKIYGSLCDMSYCLDVPLFVMCVELEVSVVFAIPQ